MFELNYIKYEIHDDGVAFINLNRNSVNSINITYINELDKVINDISNSQNVKIVVFRSLQKHFCAGADLKERKNMTEQETLEFIEKINQTFNKIEDLKIPTIASIHGAALGGGLELALCCDFRVASESSLLGLTETSLGIIPGAGGIFRLLNLIGLSKSKYWIFSAQKFSPEKAYEDGVVDFLSKNDELLGVTLELAQEVLENSPNAIKVSKEMISQIKKNRTKDLTVQFESYKKVFTSKDKKEALKAFIEKRKPNW
tara:strand:- start:7168 stop:7938 length:771 start_codon:yes stop_codon:yes gene_type:complete